MSSFIDPPPSKPPEAQAGRRFALLLEYDGSGFAGSQLQTNDNWRTNEAAIVAQAPTLAPSRDEEPALIATLAPGQYTAIVEGKGATGVATVEAYALP